MGIYRRVIAFTLLVLVTGLQGCAVNPVTGKNELSLVSEQQEIALGKEQYLPTQQSQGGQFRIDPELTRYVAEVGARVAARSDRQLPYEFVVLNNPVPNAWTLPGGKIAVNRGLLLALDSEAELAAVLGHEIVHAAARHGAKAYERGLLLQGVMLATQIYSSDRKGGNYIVEGAALGSQLVSQKYGRDAEREADYYGTRYMAAAGYDPEAAVTLQEKFVKLAQQQESNWLEGLFASHPPSQERVENNREVVKELGTSGEWGRERYAKELAFLRSVKPAYDDLDEAEKELAKRDTEGALASIDKAIALEPKEAQFYGVKGVILLQQNRNRQALEMFDQAVERDRGYFQYYLGRGTAYSRLGNRAQAKADFERSNQLLPTAQAMNELGKIALASGSREVAKGYFKSASSASGDVGREATRAFIDLDLADNPGNYVSSRALLSQEGRVLIQVLNRSNVDLKDVHLRMRAMAGDREFVWEQQIGRIGAGAEVRADTGVRSTPAVPIHDVAVEVIGISI